PEMGETLESSTAIDNSNNVYIATSDGTYSYKFDGSLRWHQDTAISIDGTIISLSPDNNFAYIGGVSIYKVKTSDGSLVWKKTFGNETFGTVITISSDGNTLYVGAGDGFTNLSDNFYALNANDGSIKWTYVESSVSQQENEEYTRGHLGGAIIDNNGVIYLTNQHGYLVSLTDEGDSSTVNWKFNLQTEARMPASISGDFIYQSSNSGLVHKIHKLTGVEVTSDNYPALGNIGEVFTPVVFSNDGNTFYINAEDRNLYAIDTKTGSKKWSFLFEEWGSDPIIRNDGVIIVMGQLNSAGRVCAIKDNGSSASLLWSSDKIVKRLPLNETNVNIAKDGTIYVHAGDQSPLIIYALKGNGMGLSDSSPWPKLMGNIQNNGYR
ncbi:MAG: PQQ-like beta-propeller repeat protein, partial [Flavobacteriaceae bacterium]|nr:PQQ-like beta-propeller repeat protein [Flavobacteriaceae bacterium]